MVGHSLEAGHVYFSFPRPPATSPGRKSSVVLIQRVILANSRGQFQPVTGGVLRNPRLAGQAGWSRAPIQ